ncbi:hypothetical protein NCS57_00726400 [Fusarium keratoplasticum]|uniref:Uncharacterized protein n=1 Tax=Fusarium keratoplasticum TaxID=1328300 RepID=A0ACC0QW88_9HYPO|nr:hypothetical protein NCS57_00726400 [Fusarium keratoplasticum]KAI8669124.1 hypothetical protein NCS57_00726400 [Fusarium keratoplasticum]KAI8673730.1 hypothetical protein NCS55_00694100 [Fusarium keratoplasticum]
MIAESKSVPQIEIMAASPTTTTTTTTKPRREPRDTGFPEPFNDVRNTTLPHPDADLSPNACISQEDIDPNRALTRTRRSFLRKKRRTLNHGRITPTSEALYSVLSLVSTDTGDNASIKQANPSMTSIRPSMSSIRPSMSSIRLSKDETESLASRNTRRDEETPPTSPDVPSYRSKKGFMRKWRKN